ncbi:hypothetical protein P7C70_g8829, partial [Phenoliferia sp. Uapishka_3]
MAPPDLCGAYQRVSSTKIAPSKSALVLEKDSPPHRYPTDSRIREVHIQTSYKITRWFKARLQPGARGNRTSEEESEDALLCHVLEVEVSPFTCKNISKWFQTANEASPPSCKVSNPDEVRARFPFASGRLEAHGSSTRLNLSVRQADAWIQFVNDTKGCDIYLEEAARAVYGLNVAMHDSHLTDEDVTVALDGHSRPMREFVVNALGKGQVK